MISVRSERIASACLRETTVCFALRRPFAPVASERIGRMSPSAIALNRSTTYFSSARPVPKKCTRNVSAVLPGIAIAAVSIVPV